ncbi:MAG TPA: medium chain dehydrogenase/reductase family protein [Polyangia bacterium]|nr:medium chain dehydrogenase/reductase family protein [Polyangia bacterium]
MRQIWITKTGAPEVLQVREAPDPDAGAGQIRVRVRAAGINFADLMARVGLYPDAPKLPCVVGYEVGGTVDQVGAGVTGFAAGDRVLAMPHFGGYTDTLVVPAAQAAKLPDAMSFEEGAALPVVYLTAHHMMIQTGNLRPGSKVLIHSAAGGVGLAAIELAAARKCVIFGTASPSKHDFLRARGVQHPIDSSGDYVAEVRKLVGDKGGLDLVLDPVGGKSWQDGYDLLDAGGRLVAFGFSGAAAGKTRSLVRAISQFLRVPKFSPMKLMDDNKQVAGVNMGHLFDRLDILYPQIEALLELYKAGQIKPYVDRSFKFDEAPAAHHYIHDRKAKGKVLLVP